MAFSYILLFLTVINFSFCSISSDQIVLRNERSVASVILLYASHLFMIQAFELLSPDSG